MKNGFIYFFNSMKVIRHASAIVKGGILLHRGHTRGVLKTLELDII